LWEADLRSAKGYPTRKTLEKAENGAPDVRLKRYVVGSFDGSTGRSQEIERGEVVAGGPVSGLI
jgi:hypothetical protein